MDAKVILEARRRIVGPNVTLLFDEPIHMVRGEGVHLYDADGNEYLDTVNNVAHVGHCHPKVMMSYQCPTTVCMLRCVKNYNMASEGGSKPNYDAAAWNKLNMVV